jgi:hypothetical protein
VCASKFENERGKREDKERLRFGWRGLGFYCEGSGFMDQGLGFRI